MARPLYVSLVVHAAAALGLWWAHEAPRERPTGPLELAIVTAPARHAPEAAAAESERPATASATSATEARAPRAARAKPSSGGGSGTGGGDGTGIGIGSGSGSGSGSATGDPDGTGLAAGIADAVFARDVPDAALPRLPASLRTPPTRARPPRLVWPANDRDEIDGRVFVVTLHIDAEGYVVGVKLVRGVDRHRDHQALAAVWRFRYAPALDDAGRPVAARLEQHFMIDE